MRTYPLLYGHSEQLLALPDPLEPVLLSPPDTPADPHPLKQVENALQNPLNQYSLALFSGARSVAIAINDKTRPVPHAHILPPLLRTLRGLGIPKNAIELIVATGTHAPMSLDEIRQMLPAEITAEYHVFSHNIDQEDDFVDLGVTQRGTPVLINRHFVQADLKIVTGNIEPHHFMGFSGGVKSASIGLAGRPTINHNHAMLVHADAKTGEYDHNPMRQDVEEMGQMIGVDFALSTILNQEKEIIRALAGRPLDVMQAGIAFSRQICQVSVEEPFDLVIASGGGYPKDINLYQAQKALTNAAAVTRDGGVVILLAECREGSGSPAFERFIEDVSTPDEVFEKFAREGFRVGPHKAFQIARIVKRVNVILVSSLSDEQTRRYLMTPAPDLQAAFSLASQSLPPHPRTAIMPYAVITIPMLRQD